MKINFHKNFRSFLNNTTNNKNILNNHFVKQYSSKRHNTNFDYHLDWFVNTLFTNKLTITNLFLGISSSVFLYSWLQPSAEKRYYAQENVSFSATNMKQRDYINLFVSNLGSRKPEEFIFDSAILLTMGTYLEKIHGTPFMCKLFLFGFYMSLMSSCFWVNSEYAKNERFLLADPKDRYQTSGEFRHMKFSSMHGLSMSVLYFFLFKRMKLAVIPVLAVDYMFWGPLYSAGALNGIAWAMTV
jgi:hypothetical protein